MASGRSLRSRSSLTRTASSTPASPNVMTRHQKLAAESSSSPSASISSSPSNSPEDTRRPIRLTVKMPSSKLREVMTGNEDQKPHNIFTDTPIMTGPRNSRSKKRVVEVDTDDEEDLESLPDDEETVLSNNSDDADDSDADADGEPDIDAEGDIDMDDAPPLGPSSKQAASRHTVSVAADTAAKVRNLEAKNVSMDDEDDEEELSELDSDAGEPGERAAQDDMGEEEEGDEDDEEDDSDIESGTPMAGSRAGTPDYTKMTKRQRGRIQLGGDFLQLPMGEFLVHDRLVDLRGPLLKVTSEPQVKKHLTAEEHAMRRAEMARRRKNLSEKRNEEEKVYNIHDFCIDSGAVQLTIIY